MIRDIASHFIQSRKGLARFAMVHRSVIGDELTTFGCLTCSASNHASAACGILPNAHEQRKASFQEVASFALSELRTRNALESFIGA
jgi:hypothetical protein